MDVTSSDAEVVPEKIEDKKDGGLTFHCNLSDTEIVHKIAQEFLPGLASACVDNTTGDIFRTSGSVAVDIRTEMVEYLTKRSETFVAESVILEDPDQAEVSDHPYDIISDFVDDFALSKRNLFSRVSGWMLSEKREDKIDDFLQEMEISGFWSIDRREAIAHILLKNVDFKNEFHCDMKFNSEKELNEHMLHCGFISMICPNEGCNAKFSAGHLEKHDSVCPFKIIPCEQKCPDTLMRRDMDRHCITVCQMKLANCPFYAVGCQSTIPQCIIQQHCHDNLRSHLLYILQKLHRDKSLKVLKKRVEELEKSYFDKLAEAPDVRSLSFAIKDLEAKLGPFKEDTVNHNSEEGNVNEEKLNGEGTINGEVNISEEGKVNATEKVDEKEEFSNESKPNEGGKGNEQEKDSDGDLKEGKNNGSKVNDEERIRDEQNVNTEGTIDGGKINDETRVNEEGKANEAGKATKGEKVGKGEES